MSKDRAFVTRIVRKSAEHLFECEQNCYGKLKKQGKIGHFKLWHRI